MAFTLLIAAAAAAAQPSAATDIRVVGGEASSTSGPRLEVAYDELAQGQNAAAVAKLEALPRSVRAEPAAQINLATAYARMGRRAEAEQHYAKAASNQTRYYLELADGTWVSSHKAARMGLSMLAQGQVLALRN